MTPLSPAVEFVHLGMRFGDFTALEDVSLTLEQNRFHVLLGENGAGKSTLMKCLVGYQKPTTGQIVVNGHEVEFASPKEAHRAGVGMVYQHFTLADNLTVAENFLLSREDLPFLVDRRREEQALAEWMKQQPFQLPLNVLASSLAAGEKQKLEILMQLHRQRSLLILDEPSSVLTPAEADEILGLLKARVEAKEITILLITHKFRELTAFGDTVAVLRRGRLVAHGPVADYSVRELSGLMVGEGEGQTPAQAAEANHPAAPAAPVARSEKPALELQGLQVTGSRGTPALRGLDLQVYGGEIVGIAGVSGNGQKELVEALMGLHPDHRGRLFLHGEPWRHNRTWLQAHGLALLPELPLANAAVATLPVWENLALHAPRYQPQTLRRQAEELQRQFGIRAAHLGLPLRALSGGNVQRTVLARELHDDTQVVVVANPCFGLDFQAAAEIRQRLVEARNRGAAVLLVSEDLDEILELADRVAVLFDGHLVLQAPRSEVDTVRLGQAMAGHAEVAHV